MDWTPWYNIEICSGRNSPLNRCGVYRIRIVDFSNEPISIGRICGIDFDGVVYIGRSVPKNISNRMGNFNRGRNHSGAKTYNRVKDVLNQTPRFADHHLQVQGLFLNQAEVIDKEAEELYRYLFKFGELPPFNSKLENKKVEENL